MITLVTTKYLAVIAEVTNIFVLHILLWRYLWHDLSHHLFQLPETTENAKIFWSFFKQFPHIMGSLWPLPYGDIKLAQHRLRPGAQVRACCLVAPSHYQNQCWLHINEVQVAIPQQVWKLIFSMMSLKITLFIPLPHLLRAVELKATCYQTVTSHRNITTFSHVYMTLVFVSYGALRQI